MKRPAELSKIISIAKVARKRVERLATVERGPVNLAGYCCIAARYIELLANRNGIHPLFVAGSFMARSRRISGHSWVEYEGNIIDITATQFKGFVMDMNCGQKVYTCKSTNEHYVKELVGDAAKYCVRMWYSEPIDNVCSEIDRMF